MLILELLFGLILFACSSLIFWRIGQEQAFSPRWRAFPGLSSLAVLVVLGGWSGGISMVVHSIAAMMA